MDTSDLALGQVVIFWGIKYEPLSDLPIIKICEWGPRELYLGVLSVGGFTMRLTGGLFLKMALWWRILDYSRIIKFIYLFGNFHPAAEKEKKQ